MAYKKDMMLAVMREYEQVVLMACPMVHVKVATKVATRVDKTD